MSEQLELLLELQRIDSELAEIENRRESLPVRIQKLAAEKDALGGVIDAACCALDAVHTVVSASETHNLKNVNRPIAQSLADFEAVIDTLKSAGIAVEGGIATAFGCPFEGVVPPDP